MSTIAGVILPVVLAYMARGSLAAAWGTYCRVLEVHPLTTKMATGAIGCFLGDLLAQFLSFVQAPPPASSASETGNGKAAAAPGFVYDVPRAARMIIYATFIASPLGHAWFGLLDGRVFPHAPVSPQAIITKMLLDQLVACPLLTSVFFMVMKAWEGHPEQAWQSVQEKLWPTLKANYILWPAAHLVGFAFVPPSQRILYVNVIAIFWTAYVSTILNTNNLAVVETGDTAVTVAMDGRNSVPNAVPTTVSGSSEVGGDAAALLRQRVGGTVKSEL